MTDLSNYLLAWMVYLLSATAFYVVFWQLTRFKQLRILGYCLRAVMLAMIATPWYVSTGTDGSLLAPAIIVMLMDAITINGAAAVRAFVPLLLSNVIALALVAVYLLIRRDGQVGIDGVDDSAASGDSGDRGDNYDSAKRLPE